MNDNRLKQEYLAMEIPEMKTGILAVIRQEKSAQPRRKLRPACIAVMAAMLVLLTATVGAAVGGVRYIRNGSRYMLLDSQGNLLEPKGFHLEERVDVQLSEKALANITPYIFSTKEVPTPYETIDRGEMESFVDMAFHLPDAVADKASLYRLRAVGRNGEAVTIYVQIQLDDEQIEGSMSVYLRSGPQNILAGSDPEVYDYALPDGTPVNIAIMDRTRKPGKTGHAIYKYEDALYDFQMTGDNSRELLDRLKEIIDTVGVAK